MEIPLVVHELKRALTTEYGPRLHSVVLFGSHARGSASPTSDVDVLVVLDGPVDVFEELDRLGDLVHDLSVTHGQVVSLLPMSLDDYLHRTTPLLLNVRRDGVVA